METKYIYKPNQCREEIEKCESEVVMRDKFGRYDGKLLRARMNQKYKTHRGTFRG